MNGYWKRPKETEEALRGGYMHTGDLATIDEENFIFIVDRAKDMIVSGGEIVYCAEVEYALYDHPDVLEAAVIGIPDDRWGRLLAIGAERGQNPSEGELIEHCRGHRGVQVPSGCLRHSRCQRAAGRSLDGAVKPYWEGKTKQVNCGGFSP
jgi:long-chain acyl-CoA synthetase